MFQFVVVFSAIQYSPPTYGAYKYPAWGEVLAWLMVIAALIFLPICMIIECCRNWRFKRVRIKSLF
jgi:hypothetical protein